MEIPFLSCSSINMLLLIQLCPKPIHARTTPPTMARSAPIRLWWRGFCILTERRLTLSTLEGATTRGCLCIELVGQRKWPLRRATWNSQMPQKHACRASITLIPKNTRGSLPNIGQPSMALASNSERNNKPCALVYCLLNLNLECWQYGRGLLRAWSSPL